MRAVIGLFIALMVWSGLPVVPVSAQIVDTAPWRRKTDGHIGVPAPFGWAASAYDTTRGRYLFIGGGGDNYFSTVWEYRAATNTWTVLLPHGIPNTINGRDGHVAAYDPYNKGVWMGCGTGSGGFWFYDTAANRWISYNHVANVDRVAACQNAGLVFDPVTRLLVVFSGEKNGNAQTDTWVFDTVAKTGWVRRTPAGGYPGELLADYRTAYDSRRGRILYLAPGGLYRYDAVGDAWALVPTTGTFERGAVAYDPDRDLLMSVRKTGTWLLELSTGSWRKMNPSVPLPNRGLDIQLELQYDLSTAQFVLVRNAADDPTASWPWGGADTWLYRPDAGADPPPPPDSAPPVIRNVRVDDVTPTAVTVRFETNEPAAALVEWGLSEAYGRTRRPVNDSWLRVRDGGPFAIVHGWHDDLRLGSLTPGTTYHFRVLASDPAGNTATSADFTFTTPSSADLFVDFTDRTYDNQPGYTIDLGELYDPLRRFGWDRDISTFALAAPFAIPRYTTGVRIPAGEAGLWRATLEPGRYRVSVAVGDPRHNTGPHVHGPMRIDLNDVRVIDDVVLPSNFFAETSVEIDVPDGTLNVRVGGAPGGSTTIGWLRAIRLDRPPTGGSGAVIADVFTCGGTTFTGLAFAVGGGGTIARFTSPALDQHIGSRSGFKVCYAVAAGGAATSAYDVGSAEAGWLPAITIAQPGGPGTFPIEMSRITADGRLKVTRRITGNSFVGPAGAGGAFDSDNANGVGCDTLGECGNCTNRTAHIVTRVENLSAATVFDVQFVEIADFDVRGDDDRYARTADAIIAFDDAGAAGSSGMILQTLVAAGEPYVYGAGAYDVASTSCHQPGVTTTTPTAPGDFEAVLRYPLGSLGPGAHTGNALRLHYRRF